ncbi:hypothetical protein [Geoglobus ahangari]
MGRRNKYLGTRVPDVGKRGLDSPSEFEAIMREIERDLRNRKISMQEARGRLLLLYRLSDPDNNRKVKGWSPQTRQRIQRRIRDMMGSLDEFNLYWNL